MKHIKIFEKYNSWEEDKNMYWEVILKRPYFNLSLKKIGVPTDLIDEWNDTYVDEDHIVYVYKEDVKLYDRLRDDYDIMTQWRLQTEKDNRDISKFMGRIKLQDFEINADKFNL